MQSIDQVYAALKEVGAPVSSRDDVERLYKGQMAEVLDFVATHLRGRKAVASARGAIQAHREEARSGTATSLEQVDPLYTRAQRAKAKVKTSEIALQKLEDAYKKQVQTTSELENEYAKLQKELESQRSTALLLSILERKENIRKMRFDEILQLLEKLRAKIKDADTTIGNTEEPVSPTEAPTKPIRAEHTRDTLAALQAYSLRLSRLSASAKDGALPARTKATETRLLNAIARAMGSSADDPAVVRKYEECRESAKARARQTLEYRSPLPVGQPDEDLSAISERVRQKEVELQALSDKAAALTLACARALQSDTIFANETAPQLKDALHKEAAAAQGYIDVLRLSINHRARTEESTRDIDGDGHSLSDGRSFSQVLADIEQTFTDAQETESFLTEARKLISPDPDTVETHKALATSYAKEESEVSSRLQTLLERKSTKAEAGHVLIKDIERLIAEVAIIADSHI
ncbi:hypothetical protein C8Q70DRAFT_113135 [Cubamyces menziesii]|uniref:Uncharacterized protein n=1 Tax=Trametes cubensis TaxID=1111947 RepID=A0AAD7TMH4_9APHY|nr:hypothetical protein C8Q70DRAFT_113135 [Cubamyces menziesii]KAJ8468163.1 hypothetical protein ONZ51_g9816 [Trametes cubensis]